jgi:hypothetical protein
LSYAKWYCIACRFGMRGDEFCSFLLLHEVIELRLTCCLCGDGKWVTAWILWQRGILWIEHRRAQHKGSVSRVLYEYYRCSLAALPCQLLVTSPLVCPLQNVSSTQTVYLTSILTWTCPCAPLFQAVCSLQVCDFCISDFYQLFYMSRRSMLCSIIRYLIVWCCLKSQWVKQQNFKRWLCHSSFLWHT